MSITTILIIVTVIISVAAFNNPDTMGKLIMNPYQVFRRKEYWRLLTSGFIHGDYIHLGFNMFTFYYFGRTIEQVFRMALGDAGAIIYVLFYLSAIVISDLPSAWKRRDMIHYNSLGASGAVSAMVMASIVYFPIEKICMYGLICLPGFILGIGYVVYSYLRGKNSNDHINHEAHLYGAIYGIVIAIWVYPSAVSRFIEQITHFKLF